MADFLSGYVKTVMDEEIKTHYPHIRHPSMVYAKVVEVEQKQDWRQVTLRILTRDKELDGDYPAIPFVKTVQEVSPGENVVIGFLYGECIPYILGRCLE